MIEGLCIDGPLSGIFARWNTSDPKMFSGFPALFVDRDGVIVEDTHYLSKISEVRFIEGVKDSLKQLKRNGVPVIVVTNQAGIGRGYYGWEEFVRVEEYIERIVSEAGGSISACLACPHHPEGRPPYRHPNHPFRKPNSGMLLWAARTGGIDLSRSWLVGDKLVDLQAGAGAGLAGLVHVDTGHGDREREIVKAWASGRRDVVLCSSLSAARWFLFT